MHGTSSRPFSVGDKSADSHDSETRKANFRIAGTGGLAHLKVCSLACFGVGFVGKQLVRFLFLFFFVLRDDAESGVVAYTAEVRVQLFLFQSVVQMAQKVHFAWPSAIKRNKRVFVSRAPFTSLLCFASFALAIAAHIPNGVDVATVRMFVRLVSPGSGPALKKTGHVRPLRTSALGVFRKLI